MPRLVCAVVVVVAGLIGSATAAELTPADQLLRRTPDDATFVVVLRDLSSHWSNLHASPFSEMFRASPVGKQILDTPEIQQLSGFGRVIAGQLKLEWPDLRDNLVGDAVVLAYKNGPPGKPEQEAGILLAWTRDPKMTLLFADRLNEAQRASGELKDVRKLEHQGKSYHRRIKAKDADEYYLIDGSLLAFSSQESMIKAVIERSPGTASPFSQHLQKAGVGNSVATLLINPRRFDAELDAQLKASDPKGAAFLKTFRACWLALDTIALTIDLNEEFRFALTAIARPDDWPPQLLRFLRAWDQPSEIWKQMPDDRLAVVAGRLDLKALIEALEIFLTPEARAALQESIEKGLAPVVGRADLPHLPGHLGPEWGICLLPSKSNESPLPQALVAVKIRPGKEAGRVEQTVLDGLDVISTLARVAYNSNHPEPMRMVTTRQGNVDVKSLVCDAAFPPGFRPSYAVKNGYLVLATSPEAIARFGSGTAAPSTRFIEVSMKLIAEQLSSGGDGLRALLTGPAKMPKAEADQVLARLQDVCSLFERIELASEAKNPGELKLVLRVRLAKPLK